MVSHLENELNVRTPSQHLPHACRHIGPLEWSAENPVHATRQRASEHLRSDQSRNVRPKKTGNTSAVNFCAMKTQCRLVCSGRQYSYVQERNTFDARLFLDVALSFQSADDKRKLQVIRLWSLCLGDVVHNACTRLGSAEDCRTVAWTGGSSRKRTSTEFRLERSKVFSGEN